MGKVEKKGGMRNAQKGLLEKGDPISLHYFVIARTLFVWHINLSILISIKPQN